MCNANGPPTPGLRLQLALSAENDFAFSNAQTLGRIQQLQNFGANSIHGCRATHSPFVLDTFLCTLQAATSNRVLIRSLQHSIRGAWLTLTSAGFTPASQTDLASPHVHHIVITPLAAPIRDVSITGLKHALRCPRDSFQLVLIIHHGRS